MTTTKPNIIYLYYKYIIVLVCVVFCGTSTGAMYRDLEDLISIDSVQVERHDLDQIEEPSHSVSGKMFIVSGTKVSNLESNVTAEIVYLPKRIQKSEKQKKHLLKNSKKAIQKELLRNRPVKETTRYSRKIFSKKIPSGSFSDFRNSSQAVLSFVKKQYSKSTTLNLVLIQHKHVTDFITNQLDIKYQNHTLSTILFGDSFIVRPPPTHRL